jgi:hypothetical protein
VHFVVVVGGRVVVVVDVVDLVVVVVVVLLELDDFEVDEVLFDVDVVDDEVDVGSVVLLATVPGWLGGGSEDLVVPSVATCSSRSGGLSVPGRWPDMPTVNNATTVAPRNAPTANRNDAPCWSSTHYVYRVNPIGSSGMGLSTKSRPPDPQRPVRARRGVWGVAPQNYGDRHGPRFPWTWVPRGSG